MSQTFCSLPPYLLLRCAAFVCKAETLIPVYTSIAEAVKRHPAVSVMVNFSSFRSVYETTMDALNYSDTIKTLAIIAEGVPESQTREIIKAADEKKVRRKIICACYTLQFRPSQAIFVLFMRTCCSLPVSLFFFVGLVSPLNARGPVSYWQLAQLLL